MKYFSVKKIINDSGLSLIEVMASLLITMIIFLGLFSSFPLSLSINKTAESAGKAAYIAQDKLEEFYALDYSSISIGTVEAKHRLSADPGSYLYNFQRQTSVEYVDGSLQSSAADLGVKKISVTVYYTNSYSKNEKSFNITALISQW